MDNKTLILKCLVGSHAHGLATPESDYDYRGVYVLPTQDILALGYNYKGSHWLEGEKEDQTAYEIGHFLFLATKCNPTILEVMVAPEVRITEGHHLSHYGAGIRELLPYCWNPQQAFDAFVGYGLNQRKKMLDNHLDRWNKYGVAYLRTLWNLNDLLNTGTFSLKVTNEKFKDILLNIKAKKWTNGQIIDHANKLTELAKISLSECDHKPDHQKVNDFLIGVRKEFFK